MTNDKDSAVLKACPFCGSANIDPEGWGSENSSGPACDDCGASAGSTVASTPEENIEAWNKRQPTQSDALQIAREALEGMVRYSGMRESWQDGNPQYVEAARDAIGVIDAALQEQSK